MLQKSNKQLSVVMENDEIYVINKPAGMSCQGGVKAGICVDMLARKQLGESACLVHRLDKETAGLLIIAKNKVFANIWTRNIALGRVRKSYIAVVWGCPNHNIGVLNTPVRVGQVMKDALSHYKVLKTFSIYGIELSYLHLTLDTGRKHQIRQQCKAGDFAIVGDNLYGDFRANKLFAKQTGIKQLLLCSYCLNFDINLNIPCIQIALPEYFMAKENHLIL